MFRRCRRCRYTVTRVELLLCTFIVLLLLNILNFNEGVIDKASSSIKESSDKTKHIPVAKATKIETIKRTSLPEAKPKTPKPHIIKDALPRKVHLPHVIKTHGGVRTQNFLKGPVFRPKKKAFDPMGYPLSVDIGKLVRSKMENKATEQTEINPHPYEYIHNPGAICEDESTFIVVLVKSKVDNFEYREAIRYSWGTSFKHLVFLLGASENTSIQNNVTKESQIYNDIVQENFIDDYCNNTLKTIMGFNWAHTYCHSSRYHLFVDDDVFVVKDNLDFLYRPPTPEQTLFIGRLFLNSVPYRDNGSKWYISWEDYPFDRWPPYIAGGAFVTSARVTQMLNFAFPFVKYLGIDDAYLGIVSKKLGLRLTTWNGFMMNTPKRTHTKLNYRRIVAYHRIDEPQKMYTVWKNYLEFKKELRTPIPFKP